LQNRFSEADMAPQSSTMHRRMKTHVFVGKKRFVFVSKMHRFDVCLLERCS